MNKDSLPIVAFLGPFGTYSHQATYNYFGENFQYQPEPTIAKVFASLSPSIPFVCIPLANSTHGPVIETMDLFRSERWAKDAFIRGETTLKIEHCLVIADTGDASQSNDNDSVLSDITVVYSHEQALGQCSEWLDRHLPQAKRATVDSTAEAARRMTNKARNGKGREAAICSEICVQTYPGLRLVKRGIQDRGDNQTRFVVIGSKTDARLPTKTEQSFRALLRLDIGQSDLTVVLGKLADAIKPGELSIVRMDRRPSLSRGTCSDVYFVEVRRSSYGDSFELDKFLDSVASNLRRDVDIVRLGVW